MKILLNDEEIMDVISRTRIEDFTGEHEGLEQWESRLQWKQRQDICKAQLRQVAEWGNEACKDERHTSGVFFFAKHGYHTHKRGCYECWQSLLEEVEE